MPIFDYPHPPTGTLNLADCYQGPVELGHTEPGQCVTVEFGEPVTIWLLSSAGAREMGVALLALADKAEGRKPS